MVAVELPFLRYKLLWMVYGHYIQFIVPFLILILRSETNYSWKMNSSDELSTTPNPYLFTNATSISSLTGHYIYWNYTSVYIINLTLGLPLNSYVFWLILMGKGSGVVLEFFSLNLTFCEMVFCLGGLFYILTDACSIFSLMLQQNININKQ